MCTMSRGGNVNYIPTTASLTICAKEKKKVGLKTILRKRKKKSINKYNSSNGVINKYNISIMLSFSLA